MLPAVSRAQQAAAAILPDEAVAYRLTKLPSWGDLKVGGLSPTLTNAPRMSANCVNAARSRCKRHPHTLNQTDSAA